jgi:hypothetical protein
VRVFGASQTGSNLLVRGFTFLQTGALAAGDYVELEGKLYMVTGITPTTDVRGATTLSLAPSLRSAPANDALLTLTRASCQMRLVDDGQAMWSTDRNGIFSISFSGVEAL